MTQLGGKLTPALRGGRYACIAVPLTFQDMGGPYMKVVQVTPSPCSFLIMLLRRQPAAPQPLCIASAVCSHTKSVQVTLSCLALFGILLMSTTTLVEMGNHPFVASNHQSPPCAPPTLSV